MSIDADWQTKAGCSPAQHLRALIAGALFAAFFFGGFSGLGAQTPSEEYRLKAAFLYRFPQFVDYPASHLSGRKTLDLCVPAPNPFGSVLDELVQGEVIHGLPLSVRRIASDDPIDACQVLYVQARATGRLAVMKRAATLPILTVGDGPRFLAEGGIVELQLVANRVRFDISAAAAERAGLRLHPQLLRLAMNVRGGPL